MPCRVTFFHLTIFIDYNNLGVLVTVVDVIPSGGGSEKQSLFVLQEYKVHGTTWIESIMAGYVSNPNKKQKKKFFCQLRTEYSYSGDVLLSYYQLARRW